MLKLAKIFQDGIVFQRDKEIAVFGTGEGRFEADFLGEHREADAKDGKFCVVFSPREAGGPYELTCKLNGETVKIQNVRIGEVFILSGQSNPQLMISETFDAETVFEDDPLLSFYQVLRPEEGKTVSVSTLTDRWSTLRAEEARSWSAIALHVGRYLRNLYGKSVPVAVIGCYQGGACIQAFLSEEANRAWQISREVLEAMHNLPTYFWNEEAYIYHYMIEKIMPIRSRGVIWYQGEQNYQMEDAVFYEEMLKKFISDWRLRFEDESLPFVIIGIHNFSPWMYEGSGWCVIQKAQENVAQKVPNCTFVKTSDLGENEEIHPRNKKEVAKRVVKALQTLGVVPLQKSEFVPFENVEIKGGFWEKRTRLNREVSLENVRRRFEETGRFDALRFNYKETGKEPHYYFDSDVAKWMEAVAYLAAKSTDGLEEHLALCEELIDCMEKAQREDGYLNSTLQQVHPDKIFQKRSWHELYCAGHLIEAAIAYHKATGKDRFLKIMESYAELIRTIFMVEGSAAFVTPGHEEIELALIALYRHTGNKKYLDMAEFFLSQRGNNEKDPSVYEDNKFVSQDDVPMRRLHEANGHCVRAFYFYAGLSDLAAETNDEALLSNLRDVFEDVTERKMFITGGTGSSWKTESFTKAYDLPNLQAYTESCAAIGAMLWSLRMRSIDRKPCYGDLIERELFNNVLSSTSLDGKSFFYENPLEINLSAIDREVAVPPAQRDHLPLSKRLEVFGCSCCPPNVLRLFAGLGRFIAVTERGAVTIEQYIGSDVSTPYGKISIRESYATEGKVLVSSSDYTAGTVSFRIPSWCKKLTVTVSGRKVIPAIEDGYASVLVGENFALSLDFGIEPRFVRANPHVRDDAGRIALCYGPLVYCLEGEDNGNEIWQISVSPRDLAKAETITDTSHGFREFIMPAVRDTPQKNLYADFDAENAEMPISAHFIPYFTFANRSESDMMVWIRKN